MDEKITIITPTGDRPLPFALCQRWMKNQILQPDQWIVIDDGKIPQKLFIPMEYVRREPQPDDPKYTLTKNLKKALPLIKGNKIIIIEDDEYYAPGYIMEMSRRLNQHEVVGIGNSKYYHLPSGKYFWIRNKTHASLAQTAFRNSFLPDFKKILDVYTDYVDFQIWQKARLNNRGFIFVDSDKNPLYLAIKGLPGRPGIGRGHDPNFYRGRYLDKSRAILKQQIPKDYGIYLDILKKNLTDKNCQPISLSQASSQHHTNRKLPNKKYQLNYSEITGISVCYNTKNLIEKAYKSIRKFHPKMPIIIIDGSNPKDPCARYVKRLISKKTTIVSLGYNIGHGHGMCKGINLAKTKYALIFDSDIEMLKSPIKQMLEMIEENTFGIGHIVKTGFDGVNYGKKPQHKKTGYILYLHPYFQLINIKNYKRYHRYVHYGAPCYLTMIDIHKRGLSEKILKEFPKLEVFIKHKHRGTREKIKSQGSSKWEYR